MQRRWHLLDTGPPTGGDAVATLVCVHGNPTWSYLWRRVLADAPPGWRVVAVDQLGMGYSQRLRHPRRLAQRIEDLCGLTDALQLSGPLVLLAHDWGGPVGLGWAARHRDRLAAVVLTNTAVHQRPEAAAPALIRLARSPALIDTVCRRTPVFVHAATALSVPPLPRAVRDAFAAPYTDARQRVSVADFVRDIPLEAGHPSRQALETVAAATSDLQHVPSLLVWGARDPVFSDRYLHDLQHRLPHADVQRYADASHLVLEDRPDGVGVIWDWLRHNITQTKQTVRHRDRPPGAADIRVNDARPGDVAVAELRSGRRVTFGDLSRQVDEVARGLAGHGVRAGHRVAVLVPPGIDLTTLVYALWRLGAVIVVADPGLGMTRLAGALRSAGPDYLIGVARAVAFAAAARVPGRRIRLGTGGEDLERLAAAGRSSRHELPGGLAPTQDAAVLFTSGATGPPKGVVYTRERLGAQVDLLRSTFDLKPGERFVAAFAPFALYGPALGLGTVVPDIDVTAPHKLTAAGLADAVAAVDATLVFAAPAALRTIAATTSAVTGPQRAALARPRLLLSAGAPVSAELLAELRKVLTAAQTHTPYGMTEAIPVTTYDPTCDDAVGDADAEPGGVCVGRPVPVVHVGVSPLADAGELTTKPGVTGEIVVRGPHIKHRYDRRWAEHHRSDRPAGWHRTGDVGHLDSGGRLWVQGRLAHVIHTATGPLTPYPVENRIRRLPTIDDAAVVGVGPVGAAQAVAIVVPSERLGVAARVTGGPRGHRVLADAERAGRVRAAAGVPVAAVLVRDWLPVDIRHASKIDRTALADWADRILHGRSLSGRLRQAVSGSAPRTRSR